MNSATITARTRDQLANGDAQRISQAAFAVIDALQTRDDLLPGEFLGAITATFILTLEATKLPASDVFGFTRNLMADDLGRKPEFKAITEYLKKEVLSI